MQKPPKLNFPPIRLRARERGGVVEVWDGVRCCWLVLTPEEWVRQHLIAYLTTHCGVEPMRIVEECAVDVNSQPQRADVVVMDNCGAPLLIAECKAPEVRIDGEVFAQATRYNAVLGARYIVLTNGIVHRAFELAEGGYRRMEGFPQLKTEN